MPSLSAHIEKRTAEPTDRHNFRITNSETIYQGGFVGLSTAGLLTELADTVGLLPVGIVTGFGRGAADAAGAIPLSVAGNTSATEPPEAIVDLSSRILREVPVAGASVIGDVGLPVYLTNDNWEDDLTTTPATNLPPIGIIVRFHSATSFDVRTFSFLELARKAGVIRYLQMGVHSSALEGAGAPSSANVARVLAPHRGLMRQTYWRTQGFNSEYASGSVTLSPAVAGLSVSGGVLTVAYTGLDAIGDMANFTSGSAITNTSGNAEFQRGEAIELALGDDSGGLTVISSSGNQVTVEAWLEYIELPAI